MKHLRSYSNTLLLLAILILKVFHQSEVGGPGTIFNTISFVLVVFFIFVNLRINYRLFAVFIIPIFFLFLSVVVNKSTLHAGGYNAAMSIFAGYILLTLKPPPLNYSFLGKMVFLYLFVCINLSLYNYVLFYLAGGLTGNANFNVNPNPAALFFFSCIILSLVFVKTKVAWFFITVFSVLVITTGSRAGFGSTVLLFLGLFFRSQKRLFDLRALLSKKKLRLSFIVLLLTMILCVVIPKSYTYLKLRISNSGLSLASDSGGGRDVIWKKAFAISTSSTKSIVFGSGPGTAPIIVGRGMHSSYVEAITSVGWPFLVTTMIAVLYLFYYHIKHRQKEFVLFGVIILIYGFFSTDLFNGINSIWWIFIFLSLYYRSFNAGKLKIRIKKMRKPSFSNC